MFRKIRGLLQSGYPSCRQKAWIISCSHSPASGVQVIRLSFASGLASLSRFASFFSDILALYEVYSFHIVTFFVQSPTSPILIAPIVAMFRLLKYIFLQKKCNFRHGK